MTDNKSSVERCYLHLWWFYLSYKISPPAPSSSLPPTASSSSGGKSWHWHHCRGRGCHTQCRRCSWSRFEALSLNLSMEPVFWTEFELFWTEFEINLAFRFIVNNYPMQKMHSVSNGDSWCFELGLVWALECAWTGKNYTGWIWTIFGLEYIPE